MKKGICSIVILVFLLSSSVQAFAMEDTSYESEPQIVSGNIDFGLEEPYQLLVSNRYTFVTEMGQMNLRFSKTYTNDQIKTQAQIKNIIDNSLANIEDSSNINVGTLIDIFYDMHQFGTAAKVQLYSQLDKRYRVDSVTGNKSSAGKRYVYTYKFYTRNNDGTYKLYKTQVFTGNYK